MTVANPTMGEFILPYLSLTALASTFALFLCGISICHRIRQLGTSDTTSGAPFLIAFLSCAFWLQYGLAKEDNVVIVCNIVGFMLQSSYLMYYYSMLNNRVQVSFVRRIILTEVAAITATIYCVNYGNFWSGQIIDVLGSICIVLNIATIGAPLASVGEVIRTKSAESMPLPLCIASFLVSAQWLLYGIIADDFVIRKKTCQVKNFVSNYFNNSETNKADEEGKRWIKMADEMKPYRTMGQDPKSSSVTVTNASTSINTVKAKSALICASMEKKPLETFTEKSDPSPADVSKLNPKESVKPEHFMVSAVDADGKSHTVPKKPTLIDDALKLRSVENGQGVTGVPAVYTIYCEKYLDHLLQTGPPLSSLFPTTTFYESIPSEHHREVARMVGYLNEKLVAGKVITNVAALGLQAKYQQCRTAFEEKKELVESGIGLKEYNGMKMEIFELKEKVTEVEEQKKLMEKEFAEERAREKMTMDSLIDAVQEVTVHGGNLSEHTNELEDRVDQTKNKLFDFMEEHIESYKKTFSFLDDTPSEPVLSGRQLLGPDRWSSSEGEEDD